MNEPTKITGAEKRDLAHAINKAMDEAGVLTNCVVSDVTIEINAAGDKKPVEDLWNRFKGATLNPVLASKRGESEENNKAGDEDEQVEIEQPVHLPVMFQAFFDELLAQAERVDVEPAGAVDAVSIIASSESVLAKVERWKLVLKQAPVVIYGNAPQPPLN